jgi:CspA family cold shock protein
LEREGVGAKTSSGYGRMSFKSASPVIIKKSGPVEVPAGYERGVVKNFDDAKGYGFIQPNKSGPDLFVHISDLGQGVSGLKPKQKVIFKRGPGKKPASERASDVRLEL